MRSNYKEYYDWKHRLKFNVANQDKPVKILGGKLKGKIGIYTGMNNGYEDEATVRVGTKYYIFHPDDLEFVPKGQLTEAIYGS